ncbi:MAG: 30S ribosomal protein S21 [Caldiserica bacterium]|nr:MAG: 30S ribosomal protein S21 [Caldisericota bacterium]
MIVVKVRDGETLDEALRRFKRFCEREGLLKEIKRRREYKPPSVIKKEKKQEIKRKERKRLARAKKMGRLRKRRMKLK